MTSKLVPPCFDTLSKIACKDVNSVDSEGVAIATAFLFHHLSLIGTQKNPFKATIT